MDTTIVHVNANIQWRAMHTASGPWVGICDNLKLTVQADTYAELMEDIGLTLNDMFGDLLETNDLHTFLSNHGWTLSGSVPSQKEDVRFDVPFIPQIMSSDGSSRVFC